MRDNLKLSEITLVCKKEWQFKAHRILAADSYTFFITVLKSNTHPFSQGTSSAVWQAP